MEKKLIRIGVIGAGASGSLVGGALAGVESEDYSINMTFFAREAQVEVILCWFLPF